jgi:mycobactin polyketide synthetase MbtD
VTISSYRLPNGTIPVLLSSDIPKLLHDEAAAVLTYVTDHPEVTPQAVASMLFRTRIARKHRALAMVANRDELVDALKAVIDGREHPSLVHPNTRAAARRLAYVFPGQGVQRPGMSRLWYESIPAFRAEVDCCVQAFQTQFDESPLDYLLDEHLPADERARIVQPALFTQMAGLAAMWRSFGITPTITIGHSQGEIAAAYVSGTITLTDAVRVVGIRARAADEFASGDYAMAVVSADRDTCEDVLARCSGWAQLSVVNSPSMTGISGDRQAIQGIVDTFTEHGTFARVIRVQYPAHTSLISERGDKVRAAMQRRLQNPKFLDAEIDCLGATLGGPITADLPVDEYWFWNLRNIVRFDKAIAAAAQHDIDTFVEMAEHPTLQLAIQDNLAALGNGADEPATLVVGTSDRTTTDLGEFSRNLALLAVHDADYQWECLGTESDGPVPPPLSDFPNTRMNETRLWLPSIDLQHQQSRDASTVEPAKAATELGRDAIVKTTPARLLVEEWMRLSHRSVVPPRAIRIVDHTGTCAELATALCAAAGDAGATAHVISNESSGVRSDFNTLAILVPQSPQMDDCAAAAEVAMFFSDRTWWPGVSDAATDCWLVTVGGEAVVANDPPPNLVHAAASAGFRSVGAEHPGVRFRHLDLPAGSALTESANTVRAALHTAEESELAVRNGGLYAKRIVDGSTSVGNSDSSPPQHVLIIGGTGTLGLQFCDHFAKRGAQRITLVSRSGETATVADRLQQIRSTTTTHIVVKKCDVGDQPAVSLLAQQHHDMPADLIIHAAVEVSGIELADITADKVDQSLRAKVVGIWRVLGAFPRTNNCRVVLCSSIAATVGGRGLIAYAAGNRMLDAMAHRLRAEGLDCVSVQWGRWTADSDPDASGMAHAVTGLLPMSPCDALALGMSPLGRNAGVAAFDLGRAQSVLETCGRSSLLSQLDSCDDGGQTLVEETDLSQRLMKLLAETIGLDSADAIDTTIPMVAVGLDSLQALEFRRRVQVEFDYDLNFADILGGASVADALAQLSAQPHDSGQPVAPPSQVIVADRKALIESSDLIQRARELAEEAIPSNLDVERLRSARADLDILGMRAMMDTLNPALDDGAVHTADNIAKQLEFAPRHQWLLNRWLEVLTAHGYLNCDSDRGYRLLHPVPGPTCSDLFSLCADLGYPPSLTGFMQSCCEHLTELAQDRIRVQQLLFADGDTVTAVAGYRDNVIGQYLNRGAREFIAGHVRRWEHDRSPVRILELGAGIGGTTDDVIAGLSEMPVDYHFTDLSKFFVHKAKERFAEYPQIRYGIMDLNTDLREHGRYDIVVAANVLHNALHIGQSLRQLQEMINPGGALVFIETCTANYLLLTSMKFLMSPIPGQPHPGQGDIRAGARIFLTEDEWLDQLTVSGFIPLPVLPDRDHPLRMLDQRLFVAVREA